MAVIGIPVRYDYSNDNANKSIIYIFDSVRRTIQQAGGEISLILPTGNIDYMKIDFENIPELSEREKIILNKTLDKCDGLFLPGGIKFTPFDQYILDYAIKKDIPTLGICLSMQMMSCYNEEIDIVKNDTEINHHQLDNDKVHSIKIAKNSKLYNILGKDEIMVNSIHNYHGTTNHIYKTVATSPDGIIEAIEYPTATFNIGLQWHPEKDYETNPDSKLIINEFLKQAEIYSNKKNKKEALV